MDDFELPQPKREDKTFQLAFNIKIRRKFLLYVLVPLVLLGLLLWGLINQGIIGSARVGTVAVAVTDAQSTPIENAHVEIAGLTGQTDSAGRATIGDIPRGSQTLSVTKTGFLPHSASITVKRGTTDLGTITLAEAPVEKVTATITVTDYVSESPVTDAQVKIEDITGIHSQGGVYTVTNIPVGSYNLTVTKNGYNTFTTKTTVTAETKTLDAVTLVPTGVVVFESNRDRGKRGLFTSNYDGSDQKPLVARVGDLEDYTPIVGPNQKKVFFTSTRDGERRENDASIYKEFMYLIDVDGKNLTKVSETSGSYAVWSPDGGFIGYTRYTDETYSKSEVYTYDVVKKTNHRFEGYNSSYFSFSTDGKLIAFSGKKDGELVNKLFLATSNGADIREIAIGDATNSIYGMEFTANGTVRFSRYDSAVRKTLWFEYNLSTGATTSITAPAVDRESAVLSPNKQLRAYVSTRDGKTNVYLSDKDGKNERKLTDLNRVVGNILWSKDGSFIMFDYRSEGESGRYLVSTNGTAKAKKIVDINLTYYY